VFVTVQVDLSSGHAWLHSVTAAAAMVIAANKNANTADYAADKRIKSVADVQDL